MHRRFVLAMAGSCGLAVTAGCASSTVDRLTGAEENCPEPEFANERPYEACSPSTSHDVGTGIELATSSDEVDGFLAEGLNDELDGTHEEWIRETNFEESVAVAIRETSGGGPGNSDFEILGVDQGPADTIHVYTCIAEIAPEDAAYSYTRLLRVSSDERTPDTGRYTHWQEGERSTHETNA